MDAYELSLQEAQEVARRVPEAVLIGGWAIWCYSPHLKSRDIDLLIAKRDFWKLEAHLRSRGFIETHGAHLGKKGFRILKGPTSMDIDAYDEQIGPFRVEEMLARTTERLIGGVPIRVLRQTELLCLKVVAASDRAGSEKGAKDLADIIILLMSEGGNVDWTVLKERLGKKSVEGVLRTALADYRTTSKLFPLSMDEYKRVKRLIVRHEMI